MLDNTFDTHIAKYFETLNAGDCLLLKLLPEEKLMGIVACRGRVHGNSCSVCPTQGCRVDGQVQDLIILNECRTLPESGRKSGLRQKVLSQTTLNQMKSDTRRTLAAAQAPAIGNGKLRRTLRIPLGPPGIPLTVWIMILIWSPHATADREAGNIWTHYIWTFVRSTAKIVRRKIVTWKPFSTWKRNDV